MIFVTLIFLNLSGKLCIIKESNNFFAYIKDGILINM